MNGWFFINTNLLQVSSSLHVFGGLASIFPGTSTVQLDFQSLDLKRMIIVLQCQFFCQKEYCSVSNSNFYIKYMPLLHKIKSFIEVPHLASNCFSNIPQIACLRYLRTIPQINRPGCKMMVKQGNKREKSQLQHILVEQLKCKFRLTPKCHPEIAGQGIEYCWVYSKLRFRKHFNDGVSGNLHLNIEKCLSREVLSVERARKFARKSRHYKLTYSFLANKNKQGDKKASLADREDYKDLQTAPIRIGCRLQLY